MALKRESFTDGLSTIERITLLRRRMSAADQRESQAVMTALWGKWGFEHSIGACEQFWQKVPAAADAKPLSLAWYRERILREIAFVRKIVALKDSSEPLNRANLEFWILQAMKLGRLTEEAVWRFRLGDDARLGLKIRATKRRASGQAATARQRQADQRRRNVLTKVAEYRREHPDHKDRTIAANLARTTGVSVSTIRRYLSPKKTA